ncbi:amino acid permease-domain-containing protein [Cadophora sp. MPI-SDFR-AT-0126]|nr:amino acid permease-domain-containing protein [Leotiomycetes sp. MPI-SDFR-AT-0126]
MPSLCGDAAIGDGRQSLQGSDQGHLGQERSQQPARRETELTDRTVESYATGETELSKTTTETYDHETPNPQLGLPTARGYHARSSPHQRVKRDLHPWQIFFVVISGTIGLGLFLDSGEILRIAGPGGALVAFGIVGIGVISVMAGVAEMIDHWPIPGALVEFIKTFVDKELGIVLGVAYWLAYSITFGTLVSALLDLGNYWEWPQIWQILAFTVLAPLSMMAINYKGVKIFGIVESIVGILKLLLILGAFITMVAINLGAGTSLRIGSKYINDGFKSDQRVTNSTVGIPIAVYGFAGVEIIAVTALEAKDASKALKWPAKYVALIVSVAYFFSVLGFYLNVSWQDPALPSMATRATGGTATGASILLIAASHSGIPNLAGFINISLMVTVFSAANTTLYVASRTLFGLARELNPEGSAWRKSICVYGTTHAKTFVPVRAMMLSAILFIWLPWVHVGADDYPLQEIMSGIATVSVVLVWAAQCLAFIRYRLWLSRHSEMLHGEYEKYSTGNLGTDVLSHIQPLPAYIGLVGCLITVLGLSSASWWQWGKPTASNVLAAFLVPILLAISWIVLKLIAPHGSLTFGVMLSGDFKDLKKAIIKLDGMLQDASEDGALPRAEWRPASIH